MSIAKKCCFLFLMVFCLSVAQGFADDYNIPLFIPPAIPGCPDCKPRLIVVNNCDDNAIASFKVTKNPEWNFLLTQGGTALRSDYQHGTGDTFVQFALGERGSATATRTFLIPDRGAASGNISFYIACQANPDTTNPWPVCKIGGNPGSDLLGAAFLFEPTFGCSKAIHGTSTALCAKTDPQNRTSAPLTTTDYFDISGVNAYQMPFTVEVSGTNCTKTSIDGSMLDLASCPGEDANTLSLTTADAANPTYATTKTTIAGGVSLLTTDVKGGTGTYNRACIAPGQWFASAQLGAPVNPVRMTNGSAAPANTMDWYTSDNMCGCTDYKSTACVCPKCGGTQTYRGMFDDYTSSTPMTNFVSRLKEMGYISGYTWAYDDYAGNINCDQGAIITMTLCPKGGKPYDKANRWWYNTASGVNACVAVDASTPGGTTEYTSLFECQKTAINRYALRYEQVVSQITTAPYNKQALYYCVTHPATGDGVTTWDYTTCKTNAGNCNKASLPNSGQPLPAYCPTS